MSLLFFHIIITAIVNYTISIAVITINIIIRRTSSMYLPSFHARCGVHIIITSFRVVSHSTITVAITRIPPSSFQPAAGAASVV